MIMIKLIFNEAFSLPVWQKVTKIQRRIIEVLWQIFKIQCKSNQNCDCRVSRATNW